MAVWLCLLFLGPVGIFFGIFGLPATTLGFKHVLFHLTEGIRAWRKTFQHNPHQSSGIHTEENNFLFRAMQFGHFLVKQYQLFTINSLRFPLANGFLSVLCLTWAANEVKRSFRRSTAQGKVRRSLHLAELTTCGDPGCPVMADDGWKLLFFAIWDGQASGLKGWSNRQHFWSCCGFTATGGFLASPGACCASAVPTPPPQKKAVKPLVEVESLGRNDWCGPKPLCCRWRICCPSTLE